MPVEDDWVACPDCGTPLQDDIEIAVADDADPEPATDDTGPWEPGAADWTDFAMVGAKFYVGEFIIGVILFIFFLIGFLVISGVGQISLIAMWVLLVPFLAVMAVLGMVFTGYVVDWAAPDRD